MNLFKKENKATEIYAVIYAVKDELTGTFFTPIFLKGEEPTKQAERVFSEMVNNNPIWKSNPNDFSLYKLGEFDEKMGYLIQDNMIEKINTGAAYVRKEQA